MKVTAQAKWMAALAVILLGLGIVLFRRPPPPTFPVPVPNGYDDFLQAGDVVLTTMGDARVRRIAEAGVQSASEVDLHQWVSDCAEAVWLVRAGLAKDCGVPIQTTPDYVSVHNKTAGCLKALTNFLLAQARLAAIQGRTNDAFEAYLDAYRLTRQIGRGGLALDFLNSISCEALVVREFNPLIASLNREQCAEALGVVDEAEQSQEPLSVITRRNERWRRATFDYFELGKASLERWQAILTEVLNSRSLTPLDKLPHRVMWRRQCLHEQMVEEVRGRLQRRLEQAPDAAALRPARS